MKLHLYNCNCEINRLNKEPYMSNEIIVDAYQRTPSFDKVNPLIYIELQEHYFGVVVSNDDVVINDDEDIGYTTPYDRPNFAYIEEFERYYFITSHTYQNNKILVMQLNLDPFMSFKNREWINKPLYITRRTKGNSFIYDNMLQFKFTKSRINAPSDWEITLNKEGYDFKFLESEDSCLRKYCFIVAFANYNFDDEHVSPKKNGNFALPKATKNSTNSHLGTEFFVCNGAQITALLNYYYNNSERAGLVKNIMYLPYEIEYDVDTATSSIGPVDFSEYHIQIDTYPVYQTKYMNFDRWKYCDIKIPKANSYRDYEPHTEVYLNIPFASKIKLELQKIRSTITDNSIAVWYYVDYETGLSYYSIIYDDKLVLETGSCQLGYKFTITTTNRSENQRLYENNQTSLTLGMVSSVIGSTSGNGFNPLKLASGVINNVSQYIQRENSIVEKGQASASSVASGSLMYYIEPYIEILKDELTFKGEDRGQAYQNYVNNIGLPFNDYEYIANIEDNEHVIIGDVSDIDMSSDMTNIELNMLKNALTQGFYK